MKAEAIRGEGDSESRMKILQCLASQACEHFDSVLIIATCQDNNDGTYMQHVHRGNSYASMSGAERWINQMKADWKPMSET